ncbi:MAG: hypothetical protein KF894_29595 [Labilithrix sp.]|nr:hypothetical protein [Labilithrix sp.]
MTKHATKRRASATRASGVTERRAPVVEADARRASAAKDDVSFAASSVPDPIRYTTAARFRLENASVGTLLTEAMRLPYEDFNVPDAIEGIGGELSAVLTAHLECGLEKGLTYQLLWKMVTQLYVLAQMSRRELIVEVSP